MQAAVITHRATLAAVACKDGTEGPQAENKGKDIVVRGTTVCDMANGGIKRQGRKSFISADKPGLKRRSGKSV